MPTTSVRAPLFGALLLYFVLVLALIKIVPFNGVPDEGAHAQYISTIVATHALPIFTGQAPPNPGYEFHQPPLYYLCATPLWAITSTGTQYLVARVLSLVFGLLTIYIVWAAASLIFGGNKRAVTICTLLAALSPLHQGVGAGINNDSLAGLWAASLFYLVARIWLEGSSKRLLLLVGVVAGLGALTKLTVIVLGVWAFVAVGVALARRGERALPALLPALGMAFLLAAPMMIRNQSLYGDPFAYGLFSRAATQGTPGFPQFGPGGLPFFAYARFMVWQMIGTAWGFYGGPNTLIAQTKPLSLNGPRFPDPLMLFPFLLVVAIPLGGIWSTWKARRNASLPDAQSPALWWTVGVALLVLLWMNFAYNHMSGGQARYLHAALLPLTLLIGGGLSRTRSGTIAASVLGLVMLGLTLANIFVWKTLV